jgi:hypothetical protein
MSIYITCSYFLRAGAATGADVDGMMIVRTHLSLPHPRGRVGMLLLNWFLSGS